MAAADPAAQGPDPRVSAPSRPLILVGGGEHARVVADAAASTGTWQVIGLADIDRAERTTSLLGIEHLGDDDALAALLGRPTGEEAPWLVLALGVTGRPQLRRAIVARFANARWATVIHAAAWVSPAAEVAAGAVVLAGAIVNTGARIGPHAIINSGAIVEHDVGVGAFAQVGPGAALGGGASIGDDAFIGLGATVRDHVAVGAGACVGMGAAVVAEVAAASTVLGVPARPRNATR
jgi:acetyltransferase EpsM